MKIISTKKPLIFFLFLFCTFAVQAEQIPQQLVEKISQLQKFIKKGEYQEFSDALQYEATVKAYSLAKPEENILEIFSNLQFDNKIGSFKKKCFIKYFTYYEEEEKVLEQVKKCITPTWEKGVFRISFGIEGIDLLNKDEKVSESGGILIFEFNSKTDELKLINYEIAG